MHILPPFSTIDSANKGRYNMETVNNRQIAHVPLQLVLTTKTGTHMPKKIDMLVEDTKFGESNIMEIKTCL